MTSIATRYSLALSVTAPKVAARDPSVAVEGYWIDNGCYYFLAENFDSELRRVVGTPSVFDCHTRHVEELIAPDELGRLLSCDRRALSGARLDLIDRTRLGVGVNHTEYIVDLPARRVTEVRASLDEPALLSPDKRTAVVIRGDDLWLRDLLSGAERPLTSDGVAGRAYGQESQTGGGAVSYRKQPRPVGLWSGDSQWFLTQRIDERDLPELALLENVPAIPGRPVLHRYKYALPDDSQPVATYVAFHVGTGRVVTFEQFPVTVTSFSSFSLHRAWFGGEHQAWFVRFDRYGQQADLIMLDLQSGTGRLVLSETVDAGYLDLNPLIIGAPNVRTLESDEVIWFSERDGWGHLYLYEASTGRLKNRITSGQWLVREIVHVDERRRTLLMLVGGLEPDGDPARRALCAINLDGSGFEVVLQYDGDVYVASAGVSPDGRFVVARYGNVERGNEIRVIELRGGQGVTLSRLRPAENDVSARHFRATAADAVTPLYGALFLPADLDPNQQYPLIDYIYPGPQIAHAPQSFRTMNATLAESLAQLGFVVMMLDSRSTPTRDRAFNQGGYGALLEPQLSDHAAVVRQLCARHSFIRSDRIGIIGQSGGGAAAARALFDYPEVFSVGVAVCGNHNADLYAATWSDKYRGPNAGSGWMEPANEALAHKLRGRLLLLSGDMDENVHVSQSLRLAAALIDANRDFDLLIIPNAGHGVLMTSGYAQRRVWDYFVSYLLGEQPPTEFEVKFEPYELERFPARYLKEVKQ